MALDKTSLRTALETALGSGEAGLDAPSKANIEGVASAMADAIDAFVKSGTVSTTVAAVTPGVGVASGTGSVS